MSRKESRRRYVGKRSAEWRQSWPPAPPYREPGIAAYFPDFRGRPELGPESLMQPRAACIVVPAIAIHVYRRQKQAVQVHAEGQYRRKRPVDDARAFVRVLTNQDVCPREIAMRKNLWIIPSKDSKKTAL